MSLRHELSDLENAYAALLREEEGLFEHDSVYQRSRQIYLRRLLNDPNQPRHVRGWIQQELNRLARVAQARSINRRPPGGDQRRLRGVRGYDVGHRPGFAGINDNPDIFRLELPTTNRARPGLARRRGFSRRLYEKKPRLF